MRRRNYGLTALALGAFLTSSVYAQTAKPKPTQDPKPAPEITAITPTALTAAVKPRALAVTGRYFQDGLAVSVTTPGGKVAEYRGTAIAERRDTSFNVLVTLADAGNYDFVVIHPDGRTSQPFRVQVKTASLLPVVSGIRPATVPKSTSPQTIIVDGSRFMAGLSIMVTDPLPLEISGTYELIVKNPDGTASKAFTFDVQR